MEPCPPQAALAESSRLKQQLTALQLKEDLLGGVFGQERATALLEQVASSLRDRDLLHNSLLQRKSKLQVSPAGCRTPRRLGHLSGWAGSCVLVSAPPHAALRPRAHPFVPTPDAHLQTGWDDGAILLTDLAACLPPEPAPRSPLPAAFSREPGGVTAENTESPSSEPPESGQLPSPQGPTSK